MTVEDTSVDLHTRLATKPGWRAWTTAGPAGELAGWHRRAVGADSHPVMFLHPINTQGAIWEDVAEALSPERECFMPDLRAHGRSAAGGDVGLDAWLEDCLRVLDDIASSVDAVHVVGGSLGGLLACAMAAVRPEQVLSVTALGSSLDFKGADVDEQVGAFDRFGVRGTFERSFRDTAFGRYASDAVIERGIALSNPNDVETVKRVWAAVLASDGLEHARRVRCRSLVVTGELDVTCPPAAGLDLARVLGTVQVLLPDIGHMPMLESPGLVAALLDQHLREVEA